MEYQAKLQEAKLQDTATYQFFFYILVSYISFYNKILSVNFLELIQNYLEKDFCHKNVVKTPLTLIPSTANYSGDKFFIDAPYNEVLF